MGNLAWFNLGLSRGVRAQPSRLRFMQSSNELYYSEHDLVYLKLTDKNGKFFETKLFCLKLSTRIKKNHAEFDGFSVWFFDPRGILFCVTILSQ
jgi:hypothetical protein